METTVLPGGRIEIVDPRMPDGAPATVLVTLAEGAPGRSFRENVAGYPGHRLSSSADDVEAYLREERDSWGSSGSPPHARST